MMAGSLEIVSNRLFFQVRSDNPSTGIHMDVSDGFIYNYHCMDSNYKTVKIRKYFGPMTISAIHRHCALVDASLRHTAGRHLYYTNNAEAVGYQQKRTNAVFLMGCYLIVKKNWSPDRTQETFQELMCSLAPYTDMEGSIAHALSPLDCWRAVYHGMVVQRWFRKRGTEVNITLGDGSEDTMNWIVPDKLIAMEDPKESRYMGRGPRIRPSIVDFFKLQRVDTVVRLNAKDYEFRTSYGQPYVVEEFVCRAIKHHDIFFRDGGIPSDTQVQSFLRIVKKAKSRVAVHCHAGRGRTGTMLACALMRFWGFEATQAIAWVRMCRVACVVGIQQGFVKMIEGRLREKALGTAGVCRQSAAYLGGKVKLRKEEESQLGETAAIAGESAAIAGETAAIAGETELRVTIKRRTHAKSTKVHRKAAKSNGYKSVENVTVLPIGGAQLCDARRARQRAISNTKTSKSQRRIFLEQHLSNLAKNKTRETRTDVREVVSKAQHEKSIIRRDLDVLKKMHPFFEQGHKAKHLRGSDNGHKMGSGVTSNMTNITGSHSSKATLVETTKAKRREGLIRCQIRAQKSVPYELKERATDAHDEIRKVQPTKGQIKGSTSSTPFAKPSTKYSSYQPIFEHLTRLLNFDNECKPPVPSLPNGYKTPITASLTKDPKDGANSRARIMTGTKSALNKNQDTVDSRAKVDHRLAWQGPADPHNSKRADASSACTSTRNGRKDSRSLKNDFVEKQNRALLAFKTNKE